MQLFRLSFERGQFSPVSLRCLPAHDSPQRRDELPDWAKHHIEALEEELAEARAELLKAKDEAINAQSMALRRTDTLVDSIMKALEDKSFRYTTEELFEAMKFCDTAAELEKLIKQGRKK